MMNEVEPTLMQSRFVEEYIADPNRNATQAAIRAGYAFNSASTTASTLLRKPHVRKIIEDRLGKAADVVGITEVRILQELAKIGFSNIADFAALTEEGKSIRDVPREHTAAIKEVIVEETDNGRFSVKKTKLSLADKQAALIQMGKHIGMFKEKIEHTGTFTLQKLIEDSMDDSPNTIEGDALEILALPEPSEEL